MSHQDWGGKDGDTFAVQLGDVWQVGDHTLACGDLELGHAVQVLEQCCDAPDVTYTDPPWNTGIASAFRTQAKVPRKVDFPHLMDQLGAALKLTKRDVIVEMGVAETGRVIDILRQHGATCHGTWAATYSSKKLEMRMIHFTFNGAAPGVVPHATLHGWDAARAAFDAVARPGDLVFDPCLGQGGTLRMAVARGARMVGMELNPKRLSTAIAWAAERGAKVCKIGVL